MRVLVTGAGGVGGINFVRTLKIAPEDVFVVGTDYNEYYLMSVSYTHLTLPTKA